MNLSEQAGSVSAYLVGEGTLLMECGESLKKGGHKILGVVTSEPHIIDWCKNNGIPYRDSKEPFVDFLTASPCDYLFSIVNLKILPKEVISHPRVSAVNFHDGPLPRYAGTHVTTWALMNQEPAHGVSWHEMTEEVDRGRLLKQRHFEIEPGESAFSLNTKCFRAGMESFAELIDEISQNRVEATEQDKNARTYCPMFKRPKAACFLSFDQPGEKLHAFIQALNFGPYPNPIGTPKLIFKDAVWGVKESVLTSTASTKPPGTITDVQEQSIQVATTSNDIVLQDLYTLSSAFLASVNLAENFEPGGTLDNLSNEEQELIDGIVEKTVRHEPYWVQSLSAASTIDVRNLVPVRPGFATSDSASPTGRLESAPNADSVGALFATFLGRLSARKDIDLGISVADSLPQKSLCQRLFANTVPLLFSWEPSESTETYLQNATSQMAKTRKKGTFLRDTLTRFPTLGARGEDGLVFPVVVEVTSHPDAQSLHPGACLQLSLSEDGKDFRLLHCQKRLLTESVNRMREQFEIFAQAAFRTPKEPLQKLPILTDPEQVQVLEQWNNSTKSFDQEATIHGLISEQVQRTPDKVALVFQEETLTYRALDEKTNQIAHKLRALGVGPGKLCGLYLDRGIDMMTSLIGVLKAGGAYVPLDPSYPQDRIHHMAKDSDLTVLITDETLLKKLPEASSAYFCVDTHRTSILEQPTTPPEELAKANDLAYVIYTSGSTGRPKGVQIEHRNAVNFFSGMVDRVPHPDKDQGTWLAVTSLSFDISVLELLWPLTRGFKLVLYREDHRTPRGAKRQHVDRALDFGLFYFASDAGEHKEDKYRLLMEGAKFGDKNGFSSIWTPERHFHAFGGLYPNPAVASAAIAAVTERIAIRAGSCVLPLHHPVRVAEEWALVDNLSKGRVGIAFASGWQPRDFILRKENYQNRKEAMFRDIDVVQRLWRGEAISFCDGREMDVAVEILPRPIQPELPTWITTAGNPATFQQAGSLGANVLTHLLGQSVQEVGEKIQAYRKAWKDAGHPGKGIVSLMLHTLVGTNDEQVKEIVRDPMKGYLRSAFDLVKKAAWSFPTFKQKTSAAGMSPKEYFENEDLTAEETEALLDHAFERYFETSGLFGTPETALKVVQDACQMGVDEIACLIDFGVPSQRVMENLPHLNELKTRCHDVASSPRRDNSIPALIERHQVTHLQCAASMARLIWMGPNGIQALGQLKALLVGGEPLPMKLATSLKDAVGGEVVNMYGPTETTIWSSSFSLNQLEELVSIGRPIANTQCYVVDKQLELVPPGYAGELLIGGCGVARGYLNRPELTLKRFVPDTIGRSGGRLYRTGDLVRHLPSGELEFLGRLDRQIKLRGYRIELGEIENRLDQHPDIKQSIVVAREDVPGDKRLVAYLIAGSETPPQTNTLRVHLRTQLPEFMVPAHFVFLDAFPLTPNRKIDLKSLPAPEAVGQAAANYTAPSNDLEQKIADVWQRVLNVPKVGRNDNFFDLGGHSLLTVQVHRELGKFVERELSLVDLFRLPTIRSLADHLEAPDTDSATKEQGAQRGARRKKLMNRRMRNRPSR